MRKVIPSCPFLFSSRVMHRRAHRWRGTDDMPGGISACRVGRTVATGQRPLFPPDAPAAHSSSAIRHQYAQPSRPARHSRERGNPEDGTNGERTRIPHIRHSVFKIPNAIKRQKNKKSDQQCVTPTTINIVVTALRKACSMRYPNGSPGCTGSGGFLARARSCNFTRSGTATSYARPGLP